MNKIIFNRSIKIPFDLKKPQSAFLWGPRKAGKTYWIENQLFGEITKKINTKDFNVIDLLKTDVYAEYISRPALLRERWREGQFTVIDEVQKVPAILDEVQWLIQNKGASFLLTGSSARKLKRGHGNLLGGRAWRFEMGPLSYSEVEGFDIERVMLTGMLPPHYLSENIELDLRAYVSDYLKEEIVAEALTQNIPAFSEFLHIAALTNSELLNYTNVARETGVKANVVRTYFEILEDTLLGFRLKPWRKSETRRMILTEKFYYFDVGVANYLAKRKPVIGSSDFGKSFEHFIALELKNYIRYKDPEIDLNYWRTSTGLEVDFIFSNLAIEVKASKMVHESDTKGLQAFIRENPKKTPLIICFETEQRIMKNGVQVIPWELFLQKLWAGKLV